jgi:hypothetical protein
VETATRSVAAGSDQAATATVERVEAEAEAEAADVVPFLADTLSVRAVATVQGQADTATARVVAAVQPRGGAVRCNLDTRRSCQQDSSAVARFEGVSNRMLP